MTNQQGAPEALDDLYLKLHGLSKRLEGSGLIDEDDAPEAYPAILAAMNLVWRLQREQSAALVEAQQPADCGNTPYDEGPFTLAQQPAPSAAAAVNPDPHAELRKTWQPGQRWQARSFRNGQWGPWTDAVASEPFWFPHQDYRRHPDDLAPQPSPTPQADSQPVEPAKHDPRKLQLQGLILALARLSCVPPVAPALMHQLERLIDFHFEGGDEDFARKLVLLKNGARSHGRRSVLVPSTAELAPQADSAPAAAPADTVVLEAALRAIHQAIKLIGEPDTERLRTVRRVLRGAVVVAEDSNAPQADSAPTSVKETMTLQEVWEAAGGNPGISPTRADVLLALRTLDEVCDEAQADSVLDDAARLAKITQAIRDYHFALDCREHGGVAMARAWNAICDVLNMDWVQGSESAARKQGGANV